MGLGAHFVFLMSASFGFQTYFSSILFRISILSLTLSQVTNVLEIDDGYEFALKRDSQTWKAQMFLMNVLFFAYEISLFGNGWNAIKFSIIFFKFAFLLPPNVARFARNHPVLN